MLNWKSISSYKLCCRRFFLHRSESCNREWEPSTLPPSGFVVRPWQKYAVTSLENSRSRIVHISLLGVRFPSSLFPLERWTGLRRLEDFFRDFFTHSTERNATLRPRLHVEGFPRASAATSSAWQFWVDVSHFCHRLACSLDTGRGLNRNIYP